MHTVKMVKYKPKNLPADYWALWMMITIYSVIDQEH